jgi:uncharacterized protein
MATIKGIGVFGLNSQIPFKIEDDNDVIKESIFNILTTKKGEIPGNPQFGSNIHKFLFEPNLDQYWEAIKLQIMQDVEQYEPRVFVKNIEFISDLDSNKITLMIFFISLLTNSEEQLIIRDLRPV